MAKQEFWCLRSPDSTSKLAEWADGMGFESTVYCPAKEGHQRAGRRMPSLRVALPVGPVHDFVWTWYSECLLQDHVVELFHDCGFTGFDLNPVSARFKRACGRTPPRLRELVLTGWAGMAAKESGIHLLERCEGCGHSHYSACTNPAELIDVAQWDDSDFFMVWPLPKFIFVTERVTQVIHAHHLTGVVLKRAGELGFTGSGFSPGPLFYKFPAKRARELGRPLGIL